MSAPWTAADPPLARAALIALGIGIAADVYFGLGHLSGFVLAPIGLLWPIGAAVGLAAIVLVAYGEVRCASRRLRLAAAAVLLPLAGFAATFASLPPVARDELTHHLAIPALYLNAGRIAEIPFAQQSYYPMLLEMLYTPLLAWLPDNSPKVLHCLFGAAAAAVVALGSARSSGPGAGILAFALILLTPAVALIAPTAYVDLGLLLYSALALLTLLRWFESGASGWFVVSALSAGFACATKYNGLIVLLLLSLGTALAPRPRQLPAVVVAVAAYFLIALVPLAPWLIKNALQTGNPTYPLFAGLFGGRALPDAPVLDVFTRRRLLHGESWLQIAAVPLRIFLSGRDGSPARFDGVLQPILLLGIGAAWSWRTAAWKPRLLLGFAAAYFLVAFFRTDMRVRYLLPLLPPLVWLTATAASNWGRYHPRLVGAALTAAAAFSAVHLAGKWQRTAPQAYLLGAEDRATYVAHFVPELPVVDYANTHLAENARIYLAFLGTRSYYCHRRFTYETYYSGATLRHSVESSRNATDILVRLRADGITHMITADHLLTRYLIDNLSSDGMLRWRTFAASHLHRLASRNGITLYEIS